MINNTAGIESTVHTRQWSWTKNVRHKQLGKRIDYREIGDKFGVRSSTACKEVNTADTDENLQFRLVPVLGHGARLLPLELVPVPGYGAQICTRAPTKSFGVSYVSKRSDLLNWKTLHEWKRPKGCKNVKSVLFSIYNNHRTLTEKKILSHVIDRLHRTTYPEHALRL